MSQSLRRVVAWIGILGIAAGQFVASAHACARVASAAAGHPPSAVASAAASAEVAHHCTGHLGDPIKPAANLCEVHCTDGATPAVALDLPQVALAPLPAPALPLAALAVNAAPDSDATAGQPQPPPLLLQFCRLLI